MKTKTIIPILLVITALTMTSITLIPKQAHSIQGSFLYVSLSYSRGWMPWTCVVEQGLKAEDIGSSGYFTDFIPQNGLAPSAPKCDDMRICPFEYATMYGYPCAPDANWYAQSSGLVAEITIPNDLKLVTQDGHVIKDEICAGDKFKFSKGVEKGEFWQRGGHIDTPPIYWVDDIEKLVLDIMDYHDKTTTTGEYIWSNLQVPDGYVDDVAGIPVYNIPLSSKPTVQNANLTGNMVCSIKEKEPTVLGATESVGYYEATSKDISFNTDSVVECMYYYFGDKGSSSPFFTFQVPTIIQAGPDASVHSWNTHNIKYNSIEDFFRVGTINFNKNIKVVEPVEEPELKIKTILTDTELDHGETTYARLLITNNGATVITLKDIESNVNHEFIYCDKETLEPDEQADCALTLTPDTETDITATVNFEYRRCGKRIESSKKQASSTIMVQPLERCAKSEDCKDSDKVCCNRICRTETNGACDDYNGDGTFEWSYY